jgi:MFS family permease
VQERHDTISNLGESDRPIVFPVNWLIAGPTSRSSGRPNASIPASSTDTSPSPCESQLDRPPKHDTSITQTSRGIALNLALLVFRISVPSVIYVLSPAIVSEFTPVSQRGAMLTIITAVATSAGLLAPYVMGRIIERGTPPSEGLHRGFLICGVISLI